jgi:hypothetical protein
MTDKLSQIEETARKLEEESRQEEEPRAYTTEDRLESGALLTRHLFDNSEHRWIFSYQFRSPTGKRLETPEFINDVTFVVNYFNGESKDSELRMSVVRPGRLGQVKAWGVDISPGSKAWLEVNYERKGDVYLATQGNFRSGGQEVDILPEGEGLVKQVGFPFPLKREIEKEFGSYRVPFLKGDGTVDNFEFPECYRK